MCRAKVNFKLPKGLKLGLTEREIFIHYSMFLQRDPG